MPEDRRRRLLSVLQRSDALLVEDLTLAGLVFDGPTPPDMTALAPDRVVAIGSLSKVLWGGLRTGFVRADPGMILRLGRLKAAHDLGSGLLDQAAALAALPRLDNILAARRQQAREGHDATVKALAEHLPEWEVARCRGGWSLWIRVAGASGDAVVAAALREGVALSPGGAYSPDDSTLHYIRLSFVAPPSQLRDAVQRLRTAWMAVARVRPEPSLV
jgi:DNA-binding transcriptional MocR family regulator